MAGFQVSINSRFWVSTEGKHLRLRQSSFDWLPRNEEVVDVQHAWEFFEEATRYLYGPSHGLAAKALAEHDGSEFDELTTVRGLMAWLALDCGLDARNALTHVIDDPEQARTDLTEVAYFLPVITDCVSDRYAVSVLGAVGREQDTDDDSVDFHVTWARQVQKAFGRRTLSSESLRPGDITYPSRVEDPRPAVAVDVQFGKTGLLDLDTGELKYYANGYLARVQQLHV